ncbi:hypothetical protein QR680_003552 [Steinernema hermaphroditum]|uniref:Uncharacterized protein n=1 Tax=Steinernema hermaphroditum TaxID=289476 RepID=A0AA39HLT5_9BILA|nr:hypothetical protein QR680_003552 [Steinernema hermaphroditum]
MKILLVMRKFAFVFLVLLTVNNLVATATELENTTRFKRDYYYPGYYYPSVVGYYPPRFYSGYYPNIYNSYYYG